jgi:hypothetical protein
MNDAQLSSLRSDPPPEFAERLRARLDDHDAAPVTRGGRWPIARIAASVAVVGVTGALLTVPSVRASAASLLARFRVVNFVAVKVDESRIEELESSSVDLPDLVGRHIQILQEPTPPLAVVSAEQAGSVAGITVRVPEWLPPDVKLDSLAVTGPGLVQLTGDTVRLQQLMDLLGIDDLEAPAALNGKVAMVRIPSVVRMQYQVQSCLERDAKDCARAELFQAKAPEITLPEGVDLPALGEIGLRILGLSATEARQFAQTIDWRSTMLVPVPWGATSFRQVDINGHAGIAVEREFPAEDAAAASAATVSGAKVQPVRHERVVVWSADGLVYGLIGNFRTESLLQMAHSIR